MNPRLLGVFIAFGVVFADQIVKLEILANSERLTAGSTSLGPFLDLTLQWNRGVSFSLFSANSQSGQAILLALTLTAIALLAWWLLRLRSGLPAAALGLIIGGAIGNAIDRITHGAVVDYLDFYAFGRHLFVFNVADAAINIGVALLIIDLFIVSQAPEARNRGSRSRDSRLKAGD